MAGTPTTNYDLPTYADSDAPDLTGAYNAAMTAIDTQMKANADAASAQQAPLNQQHRRRNRRPRRRPAT